MSDFLEFFDENLVNRGFNTPLEDFKIEEDYIVKANKNVIKSEVREPRINVRDFIYLRELQLIGRVIDFNQEREITCTFGIEALDFELILEDGELESNTSLEQELADILDNYWNSNIDPLISVPVNITVATNTPGKIEIDDPDTDHANDDILTTFKTLARTSFKKLNIVIRLELNTSPGAIAIDVIIEKISNSNFNFRLEDPWVLAFENNINGRIPNKVILTQGTESMMEEEFYLLFDNTVTDDVNDVDRITPVIELRKQVETHQVNIGFAGQVLVDNRSNNEIKVEARLDNPINEIQFGDESQITYRGSVIESKLTKITHDDTNDRIIYHFGFGRKGLLDKLREANVK